MSISAKDIMTKNVKTVQTDSLINDVIEMFNENKITAAPVLDNKSKLTGIITKTDLLNCYIDFNIESVIFTGLPDLFIDLNDKRPLSSQDSDLKVSDTMTKNPITAKIDTPIENLAKIMIDNRVHKVIIMNGDEIAGIVSPFDFLYLVSGDSKNE